MDNRRVGGGGGAGSLAVPGKSAADARNRISIGLRRGWPATADPARSRKQKNRLVAKLHFYVVMISIIIIIIIIRIIM